MSSSARNSLAALLSEITTTLGAPLEPSAIASQLTVPPNPELGDLAFPCFQLARTLRKAPPAIAAEIATVLAGKLAGHPQFAASLAAGPYVNVRLDPTFRARAVVTEASSADFGNSSIGAGRTIAIDYSSPNIAKPFGIGHLRSTAIGNAIKNILVCQGFRVVGVNHLGDWGTQFGKLITAFERWGDESRLESDPIEHLYDIYVAFHKAAESDPALEQAARDWFKRLEDGDVAAKAYWIRFRELSLREFERIYKRLGVAFDHCWGEAWYNNMLDGVVDDLTARGLTEVSEGALVVKMDDADLPPCLIRKTDGATLYATRDIAAARWRHEQLGFERLLYVVGHSQSAHFKQVFTVLRKMGYVWAEGCIHIPFGMIQGISTRKGTLVFLEEILDRGRDLVLEILKEREGFTDDERAVVAEQIAIGAVVFYDLSRSRIKDYEFSWDAMLRGLRPGEHGPTAPYLQYTNVRTRAVREKFLEKFGPEPAPETVDLGLLSGGEEKVLIAELERFPAVLAEAAKEYEPSVVARYLLDLAEAFNSLYSSDLRFVSDDAALSAARVALVRATGSVLGKGLTILGVPCPTRM